MSRWDYDTVFYRMFCITLLAVGFTFTVILTNVFVDIDGLLYTKDKVKTTTVPSPQYDQSNMLDDVIDDKTSPNDNSQDVYDDKDYQDSNDLYRSKRSLETPEHIFHIKDPKVKKILTDLGALLDKTDGEEHITDAKDLQLIDVEGYKKHESKDKKDKLKLLQENRAKGKESHPANETQGVIDNTKQKKEITDKIHEKNTLAIKENDKNDEQFHLAIHNIILQEIMKRMNSDDVFNKVSDLVKNFESTHSKTNKDPNVIIKTIIDITAMSNDKTNKESDINSIINGIIELIYNGKTIKFKKVRDENNTNRYGLTNLDAQDAEIFEHKYSDENIRENNDDTKSYQINRRHLKKIIHDYMRRFHEVADSSEKVYSRKRLKRHIKIRYDSDKQDTKTTTTERTKVKKEDDELFVEIETHFDSKGAKGEKKKKLIKNLIEKIQNVIHSETEEKKKKPKHWHVKKRIQSPLVSRTAAAIINKLMIPLESLTHRHLDPINKVVPSHEQISSMSDVFGRSHWHQNYQRPKFFNKGINSAEMNTVDTDYNKVMSHNGIPQRLQKPLNTDISDEVLQDSNIVDLGNIKFLMKDIKGTGFSIGFNQYTGEAPDSETMKLFSGLQNIIQTYHQTYDQDEQPSETVAYTQQQDINDNTPKNNDPIPDEVNEKQEQIDKSDQHLIQRRSIKKSKHSDHHINNNYRVLYDHNVLPYNNYQEIYQSDKGDKKINLHKWKQQNAKKAALFLAENVFEKDLKPAEILSIADLFQRRKRSMNIKKISNVKINQNTNRRYLNTQSMASKNMFMQKKRNKREIDKIRIVARDNSMPHTHQNSEEDIFVVSDEKIFADRALVKEMEFDDLTHDDKTPLVEHYDIISPQNEEETYDIINQPAKENEDHYDILSPFVYEASPFESQISEFGRRARHNSLMSKYPHIITDETHRSLDPSKDLLSDAIQNSYYVDRTTEAILPTLIDAPLVQNDIAEILTPPKDNTNYRVSVKIRPKNTTGMSGFKEVHTSINKSYHKNGLMYTSLVNVSQVSKVEKMNKTSEKSRKDFDPHTSKGNLRQQHELIKSLIRQHKHRLDHQLKQLQIEKEKIENINADNTDTLADKLIEIKDSLNTNKLVQLSQEEVRKLLQLDPTTTAASVVTQTTLTISTTPITTTTEHIQPISDDPIKIKMINTFERNENITNELLRKIDQNTDVLKTFLGKLIANMEPTRKASAESKNEELNTKKEEKSSLINNELKASQLINDQAQLRFEDYHQNIPHIFFRNSQTQANHSMGIPFVYAYQQPYAMVSNKETPMASVVYHGHIHANAIQDNMKRDKTPKNKPVLRANEQDRANEKKDGRERQRNEDGEFWKPKRGEKVLHDFVMRNNSKFFLGDSSSDPQQIKMIYTPDVNATKT